MEDNIAARFVRTDNGVELHLVNWKSNRGRSARIELSVLKIVSAMRVDPVSIPETFRIYQDKPGFNERRQEQIRAELRKYCLTISDEGRAL